MSSFLILLGIFPYRLSISNYKLKAQTETPMDENKLPKNFHRSLQFSFIKLDFLTY